jgi:CelD/BcsL family acetyltransferase involved in cellulose biosynthesis
LSIRTVRIGRVDPQDSRAHNFDDQGRRHTQPVRVRPIELGNLTEAELARWRELAARSLEPNPFLEPEYLLPLAAGLNQRDEVTLAVAEEGSEWRGLLPLHRPARWHRIPMRGLTTWRGDVLYGLLGTPLLGGEDAAAALACILDWAGAESGATFMGLEWVAADGPFAAVLEAALEGRSPAPIAFEQFERAALRRRPQPTYIEETLSSKHRRELRRQRRKLGEALGEDPETVDRAGESAAHEEFIALEAASPKATTGTTLGADDGHRHFFLEMCSQFAELGRLQLLELRGGGETLAAKVNLLAGDSVFCFKIAYRESWSTYSPGIQLELDMLKLFHEESEAQFIDSCADPNNAMINRLWPDRRSLSTQVLPAAGLRGTAARPALNAARSLRERKQKRRTA